MLRERGIDPVAGGKAGAARRGVPAWLFGLLVAAYLLAFLNHTMWRELAGDFAPTGGVAAQPLFALAVALRVAGNALLIVALALWPRVGKPLLALLVVVAAASAYHMDAYGVRFNAEVMQSIFETRRSEASAMFTPDAALWIGLRGVLPALVLLCVPVRFAPWRRELAVRAAIVAGVLLAMNVPGLLARRDFTYFFRNHRVVYEVYNPYAALSGSFHYLQRNVFRRRRPVQPVGLDARLDPAVAGGRKRVLVLVVGETARAQNHSLQGYARDTEPEMTRAGAWYFRDTWSCGTATTVSVPCMFSGLGREGFSKSKAQARWNLLDIVHHAGADVAWRDNDEGCKGVCARVPNEDLTEAKIDGLCDVNGCLDDVLVNDLPQRLAAMRSPALLVLHLRGSHGPAYYQRYPAAFARFKPGCDTAEVQSCSYAQVVASYDNSILYTDRILGRVVDALREGDSQYDGAMLYLSDHGESLGENNVYLHGAAWATAPEQQKHIPMLLWLSPSWLRDSGLSPACIAAQRDRRLSQDNVFHTVLGLLGVRTALYQPGLDLLATCR